VKRIFFLCFWLHAEYGVQPKTLFKEMGEGRTRFRWIGHCRRREFVEEIFRRKLEEVAQASEEDFLFMFLAARRVQRAAKNTFPGNE